jgi:5-methylcytosine-specific restriction endonuclease McrA
MPFQKGNRLGGMSGKKHTEETKIKMRQSQKKRLPLSEETRKKISDSLKGRIVSRKSILKMMETKKKNPRFGKRAANWRGGKTRLTQLIRSSFKYRQWRSDIFQRDNYCCMDCGKKSSGDIEVHHIKSLARIIVERNIRNLVEAIRCEELWNINNGLTLCVKCHKKTDTYCNQKNAHTYS